MKRIFTLGLVLCSTIGFSQNLEQPKEVKLLYSESKIIKGSNNKEIQGVDIREIKTTPLSINNTFRSSLKDTLGKINTNSMAFGSTSNLAFADTKGELSVSNMGSAVYAIPIAIPPGIKNVAPHVSLVYDSNSGLGIAGYGWNISGISTTFEKGKTNLIIGQSGSGKTVFLKCLLGLFTPNSGNIFYDDINSSSISKKELQRLRSYIGTVFQGSALFDSMTVYENVMFPLEMFTNLTYTDMKKRVIEVLDRVNLPTAGRKYPSEISGGMQKRVAIARAIVNNPKYLFCDEPNSGLDPQTSQVIDDLIHEITLEYNTTTVINTHDMNSVLEIGEKIIYLRDGHKEWEGDKKTIFNTDNKYLLDFVFSSRLLKEMKDSIIEKNK